MEERREKRRGGRDREMGEEKKDCKKKKKKGQHGSRGVNARINRAFVEGNKKKNMHGWTVDFRLLYKKKKVSRKMKVNQNRLFQIFFYPSLFLSFYSFPFPFNPLV